MPIEDGKLSKIAAIISYIIMFPVEIYGLFACYICFVGGNLPFTSFRVTGGFWTGVLWIIFGQALLSAAGVFVATVIVFPVIAVDHKISQEKGLAGYNLKAQEKGKRLRVLGIASTFSLLIAFMSLPIIYWHSSDGSSYFQEGNQICYDSHNITCDCHPLNKDEAYYLRSLSDRAQDNYRVESWTSKDKKLHWYTLHNTATNQGVLITKDEKTCTAMIHKLAQAVPAEEHAKRSVTQPDFGKPGPTANQKVFSDSDFAK